MNAGCAGRGGFAQMSLEAADGILSFAGASRCEDYSQGFGFGVGGEEFVGQSTADRESEAAVRLSVLKSDWLCQLMGSCLFAPVTSMYSMFDCSLVGWSILRVLRRIDIGDRGSSRRMRALGARLSKPIVVGRVLS